MLRTFYDHPVYAEFVRTVAKLTDKFVGVAFTVQNFHDEIIFGTINFSMDGSLLHVIENVYAPALLSAQNWPDSILYQSVECNFIKNHI